jgi:hypothetical protein
MVAFSHPIRGVRAVGDPESDDLSIGPWLSDDPVDDLAEVERFIS